MAQTFARRREVKLVLHKRKEHGQPVLRSKCNKATLTCMLFEKLSPDKAEALKVVNLDDWFLMTKTIPPA
jgi:hypothetical protein